MSNNGNPASMDPGKLEVYIPVEAEVKRIPLWSLTTSVLRRMGLPLSDSRKLSDSPEGVWICPAVIRRKGQKLAMENMSSLLGKASRAPGLCQMSFVSANRTAYNVLKDTSHASLLPQGSAPPTHKNAVVIYRGLTYLCGTKPSQSRRQRETREPQAASESSISPTSESQKKRRASLEPADGRLERKKMCITLPQTSPKQLKDPVPETETQSTTDQEPLSDNRHTIAKITHRENKKGSDVSSSTTSHPVPQSTDRVHTVGRRGHEVAEEAAAWFQPLEEADHEGEGYLGDEEADCSQMDNGVGVVEQSSARTWTGRPSHGAPTSLQAKFDFKELAEEEQIARMKAKLRQSEAALSNLHSS